MSDNQKNIDIDKYKTLHDARPILAPIVDLLNSGQYAQAEQMIAGASINLIDAINEEKLTPQFVDHIFTLMYVFIGDLDPNYEIPFDDSLSDLLMEGMLMHHFDDDTGWGPDLTAMKQMAEELLKKR